MKMTTRLGGSHCTLHNLHKARKQDLVSRPDDGLWHARCASVPVWRISTVAFVLLPATARADAEGRSMSADASSTPQTLQLVDNDDNVWLLHCQPAPWARAQPIKVKKVTAVMSCIAQGLFSALHYLPQHQPAWMFTAS
jgi:hypothetical protein